MQLGAAAPAAYLVCAVAMALIVTSFALAGSRVSVTGGIYAYVEAAFGPFVGVLAGAVQYLVLWLTAAGLLSAFADQVSLLVPGAGQGLARIAVIFASAALLAFVNVRGVKPGARLVEGITVAKLLPLALLIGVGALRARSGEARLARMARERGARQQRAAADLRLRGNRGGPRAERRGARPGAHGAARGRAGALHHHDALPGGPGGGAGRPRQRAAGERGRAARRRGRPAAGRDGAGSSCCSAGASRCSAT